MVRAVILVSLAVASFAEVAHDPSKSQAKPSLAEPSQPHQTVDQWQQTVTSDKKDLETAVDNMEGVAKDYREAHKSHSASAAFALNLAEDAFSQAAHDASPDKKKAMDDFNNALTSLKSASPTGNWGDAEKDVRQKSHQVHKVERQETADAKQRLQNKRREQSHKMRQAFNDVRGAAKNLLKDRSHLTNAMRRTGRSEHEYERASSHLEHHAESSSEYAARNLEEAEHAVEHIFEQAEDHLLDRETRVHDEASHQRSQAIDGAVDSLREQAGTQKLYSSAPAPIDLYAESDGASKQRKFKEEERSARQAVDSDKQKLESASHRMDVVASGFQHSLKNQTWGEHWAGKMAKEVYDQAADESFHKKQQAMYDFDSSLADLKKTSATSSLTKAERNTREQSKYVDKLQEEEEKTARKKLQSKHKAQKDEVRKSYHEAQKAATNLLRDRNHLEKAMSRAGEKQSQYEKEEMRNEFFAEHQKEHAEQQRNQADDAAEHLFELASDNLRGLQRDLHTEQQASAHKRRQAMSDAVQTLRSAREGRTNQREHEELFATSASTRIFCFLSGASLALVIIFLVRRTRTALVVRPLLG